MMRYDWPGNVRQLMNVVQNMVLVTSEDKLELRDVPLEIRQAGGEEGDMAGLSSLAGMTLEQIEKQAIRNALRLNQGNREATARMLNIGERTLYRKLKEYGLK
jgi:two-component system response regulator HydG